MRNVHEDGVCEAFLDNGVKCPHDSEIDLDSGKHICRRCYDRALSRSMMFQFPLDKCVSFSPPAPVSMAGGRAAHTHRPDRGVAPAPPRALPPPEHFLDEEAEEVSESEAAREEEGDEFEDDADEDVEMADADLDVD